MAGNDPNLRGIMVDDLATGRRPLGSVAEFVYDSSNNVIGLGDPVSGVTIKLGDSSSDSITIDRSATGGNSVASTADIVEVIGTQTWTRVLSKNARGEILSISAATVT